ncbi:MAG: hypothetical protein N3A62_05460 [Thermodesulfovibrionales bacterium]|nr:hypothetical protein [Thermodesulfovibrionales bacterium]
MSVLLIIIPILLLVNTHAFADDIKGFQPIQPFGVFSTISAEGLKKKDIGFCINLERSRDPDLYRINMQLAYGLRENMEIHLSLPYLLKYEQDMYGFEDILFGFKHRLNDEGRFDPAIAYLLVVSPGFGRDEFSTNGRIGAGIVLSKKVGPFKGHANFLIYQPFKSSMTREYLLNLGTELAITHSSKILAELISRKNYTINKLDLLEWRIGLRQETINNLFTTIGAGFDIKDRKPDYRFLFYISYILEGKKATIKKVYED